MVIFEFNLPDALYKYRNKRVKLKSQNFNKLLSLLAYLINENGVDNKGYTFISAKMFRKVLGTYQPYLNYLLEYEIIERSYYSKEEKIAYGYRFTNDFKKEVVITNIYPKKYIKPVIRIQNKNDQPYIDPTLNERLFKDFKSATIIFNLKKFQIEKTKDDFGKFIDIGKWFMNIYNLNRWQEGNITYKWSNYRLYTNFTQLSSHIRSNNILLNNHPLVEFDISSSFPLMLATYCLKVQPTIINNYDFIDFCTSVVNKTFYKDLMFGINSIRNCRKEGKVDEFSTRLVSRKETKVLFQMYLNGNKKRIHIINNYYSEINNYMQMKYPEIHSILIQLKATGKKEYEEFVSIETKLVFDIVNELYDTYPDIKILTCHDAIYVTQPFSEQTKLIWDRKIAEFKKDLPVEDYSIIDDWTEKGLVKYDDVLGMGFCIEE